MKGCSCIWLSEINQEKGKQGIIWALAHATLISVEIKYAMDVLCMKRESVANAFLEIHSLLWVTSHLGRSEIESIKGRATGLSADWKNAPICSIFKAYKKSGERNTHSDNTDQVFPFPHLVFNSKFPSHLSCLSPSFSHFAQSCQYLSIFSPCLSLSSLPVSAHRERSKLKGNTNSFTYSTNHLFKTPPRPQITKG